MQFAASSELSMDHPAWCQTETEMKCVPHALSQQTKKEKKASGFLPDVRRKYKQSLSHSPAQKKNELFLLDGGPTNADISADIYHIVRGFLENEAEGTATPEDPFIYRDYKRTGWGSTAIMSFGMCLTSMATGTT
jgi:hypothetical protein